MRKGRDNDLVILILLLLQPKSLLAFKYLRKEKLIGFGSVPR